MDSAIVSIDKLEAALRALGWAPVALDRSVTSRAWKLSGDIRPHAPVIRVPRTDWVDESTTLRILRRASRIALR